MPAMQPNPHGIAMTLTDKIAALPEWPDMEDYCGPSVNKTYEALKYHQVALDCALARLKLAREWIEAANHHRKCAVTKARMLRLLDPECTCGRDALLKALEGPK